MVNLYAYTYPSASVKKKGFILTKVGDSIRNVRIRMHEQGGAAEYEEKIVVGEWPNTKKIARDYEVHRELRNRGLKYVTGTSAHEWFYIPGNTPADAHQYLDQLITQLDGQKVRKQVVLRSLQSRAVDRVMNTVSKKNETNIIANLCPRFGKTIWALSVFDRLTEVYGTKVMLLPAYWLSVHSSFINEIEEYADFNDIIIIEPDDENMAQTIDTYIKNGQRVIVPISLCGENDSFKDKYGWFSETYYNVFRFADEGDFGTHTESQEEKMKWLVNKSNHYVSIFASGTNVQRLAKCAKHIDDVIYTAYSQLEQSGELNIIKRRYYMTHVASLQQYIDDVTVMHLPSWTKIWGKPLQNQAFLNTLLDSLTGDDPLHGELNLSNLLEEQVSCFMLLVSANKKEMNQFGELARKRLPDWHIKVLNGDETTNRKAEEETRGELEQARTIDGKRGVIIIANQMGSRSYSIPEIQATVIAYDRGSVDATTQKVSRCLTPGKTYDGNDKVFGAIVDLSFDPNRSENIEKLIIDEAVAVQRDGVDATDFASAVKYILASVNMFKMIERGDSWHTAEVTEEELFSIFNNNETMLKVADISVDLEAAQKSGVFDILSNVKVGGKDKKDKKDILGAGAKNSVSEGGSSSAGGTDSDNRAMEKVINEAIRSLNMSATSVYHMANLVGESYRECLQHISNTPQFANEFAELIGISSNSAIALLDERVLNEAILDVIVQNSKPKAVDFLF